MTASTVGARCASGWGVQLRHGTASLPSCAPAKRRRARQGPRQITRSLNTSNEEAYEGRFGRWTVTPADRAEVIGYRLGITVTALALLFEGLYALLPMDQEPTRAAMRGLLNPVAFAGIASLGVSLQLIHIYLAPLKRTLQVFWAVGAAAILYLAATQDTPVPVFVYDNPLWIWAVGPLFAALTGVAFKEGLCYNKWEAAGLFGAIPLTVGGHLLHMTPENVERGLLASCMVLMTIFAGRKYTQAFKDDIGDKSVFEFQKMTPEQQQVLIKRLQL